MFCFLHLILMLTILGCGEGNYFEVGMTEGRQIKGNGLAEINVKVQKINKTTYALSGNVKIKVPLDDSYQVKFIGKDLFFFLLTLLYI